MFESFEEFFFAAIPLLFSAFCLHFFTVKKKVKDPVDEIFSDPLWIRIFETWEEELKN